MNDPHEQSSPTGPAQPASEPTPSGPDRIGPARDTQSMLAAYEVLEGMERALDTYARTRARSQCLSGTSNFAT